ncbi:uncharacterized protein LOC129173415 [Dunckerocampus dactyliophorus]|uniref:uncharacterized protein LOC129173415 n=1 Tax=Dunckerocampus dactyliophorus TaxID=161453 RepID=UPI002405E9F2|nr:uncharacterized protein LOC129173415 [Dunckerocampus dactyliophorus]
MRKSSNFILDIRGHKDNTMMIKTFILVFLLVGTKTLPIEAIIATTPDDNPSPPTIPPTMPPTPSPTPPITPPPTTPPTPPPTTPPTDPPVQCLQPGDLLKFKLPNPTPTFSFRVEDGCIFIELDTMPTPPTPSPPTPQPTTPPTPPLPTPQPTTPDDN